MPHKALLLLMLVMALPSFCRCDESVRPQSAPPAETAPADNTSATDASTTVAADASGVDTSLFERVLDQRARLRPDTLDSLAYLLTSVGRSATAAHKVSVEEVIDELTLPEADVLAMAEMAADGVDPYSVARPYTIRAFRWLLTGTVLPYEMVYPVGASDETSPPHPVGMVLLLDDTIGQLSQSTVLQDIARKSGFVMAAAALPTKLQQHWLPAGELLIDELVSRVGRDMGMNSRQTILLTRGKATRLAFSYALHRPGRLAGIVSLDTEELSGTDLSRWGVDDRDVDGVLERLVELSDISKLNDNAAGLHIRFVSRTPRSERWLRLWARELSRSAASCEILYPADQKSATDTQPTTNQTQERVDPWQPLTAQVLTDIIQKVSQVDDPPSRVHVVADRLRYAQAGWARIDQFHWPDRHAELTVETTAPDRVRISTDNCQAITVNLSGSPLGVLESGILHIDGRGIEITGRWGGVWHLTKSDGGGWSFSEKAEPDRELSTIMKHTGMGGLFGDQLFFPCRLDIGDADVETLLRLGRFGVGGMRIGTKERPTPHISNIFAGVYDNNSDIRSQMEHLPVTMQGQVVLIGDQVVSAEHIGLRIIVPSSMTQHDIRQGYNGVGQGYTCIYTGTTDRVAAMGDVIDLAADFVVYAVDPAIATQPGTAGSGRGMVVYACPSTLPRAASNYSKEVTQPGHIRLLAAGVFANNWQIDPGLVWVAGR